MSVNSFTARHITKLQGANGIQFIRHRWLWRHRVFNTDVRCHQTFCMDTEKTLTLLIACCRVVEWIYYCLQRWREVIFAVLHINIIKVMFLNLSGVCYHNEHRTIFTTQHYKSPLSGRHWKNHKWWKHVCLNTNIFTYWMYVCVVLFIL